MVERVTISRTAKTIEEAKRYASAMRVLGLTVTLSLDGYWRDESGKVKLASGVSVTSWKKGVVRGRYPNPKMREVMTATDRSRVVVVGSGPRSSPWELSF